jgi:LytR cell envelope-related transcriptional attenuator
MSTPESPQPRSGGAHRAAPAPEPAASTPLLLPLLSVVAVLAAMGLAAWMLMTSGNDETDTSPPAGAASQPTQPATQPTDEPSDQPSTDPTKDGDKNDGDKNDGGKKNDEPTAQPVPQIAVYVFNQTPISGLAAQTGDELESLGWDVVGVDNWIGNVPEDTVYFYSGDRAAADRLAKEAGVSRVWPASAPMPPNALTLILADADRK